jgi:plastocyanin
MNTRRLAVTALAFGLAACSSSALTSNTNGGGGGPSIDKFISVADFAFSPESVTVKAGSTVEWSNGGPSSHTVTSNTSAWSSMTLAAPSGMNPYGGPTGGGSFVNVFVTPGTYTYHCSIHAGMTGVVVVTP